MIENNNQRLVSLLGNQILLEVQDGVPHMIIVSNVVGAQDVNALGVLAERACVVVYLLLLVAQVAKARTETNYAVVDYHLAQGYKRNQQVKWQIGLLI